MENTDHLGLTKQRRAILQVIQESDGHLTANEVFDAARRLLPGISFATVYNSLNYLKNQGLVGEIKFGTDANLYDRKLTRHDHALCNNCGKLIDLELTIPNELLEEAASRSKFKPETIELTLRGLCPKCNE